MKILAIIITFSLLVVGIFWYVLSAKVNEVSKKEPYSKMLHVSLFTNKEMILAKNFPPFKIKELNVIVENNHLDDRAEKIALLPINTEVIFSKAFEHTGGTAGFTKILMVGEVKIDKQVYKMEYLMHPEINDFNLEKDSREFAQINVDYFYRIFTKK